MLFSAISMLRNTQDSTMLKAVNQMASQLSLGVSVHGAADISFKRMEQRGRRNLEAMAECCALMGCMLDVFDGKAHVASLSWAASQEPSGTLSVSSESQHSMAKAVPAASCTARQRALESSDAKLSRKALEARCGSGSGSAIAWEVPDHLWFSSASQLRQCCEGVLAYRNSRAAPSSAELDGLAPWTPGSVVQIECAEADGMCGKAMVSRVRCDLVSGRSKVWWELI